MRFIIAFICRGFIRPPGIIYQGTVRNIVPGQLAVLIKGLCSGRRYISVRQYETRLMGMEQTQVQRKRPKALYLMIGIAVAAILLFSMLAAFY